METLAAAKQEFEARQRSSVGSRETSKDPELDQFMVGGLILKRRSLSITIVSVSLCFLIL